MNSDSTFNKTVDGLQDWLRSGVRASGIFMGYILDIDLTKYTCSIVIRKNDLEKEEFSGISNVRLKVIKVNQSTILEVPKIGTQCLFGFIDNNEMWPQIIYCQDIDRVLWQIVDPDDSEKMAKLTYDIDGFELLKDDAKLTLTNIGFKIDKGGKGLKKTLIALIEELVLFKTQSPGGIGVTDPGTAANLNTIKYELDEYLE